MVERRPPPSGFSRATSALAWAWNSSFSRGPGYEPTPIGSAFSAETVRGYFIDFTAKTRAPAARASNRLLPAAHAQLGLGWWERSLAGDPDALDECKAVCRALANAGEHRAEEVLWAYSVPIPKYRLSPPWHSALAQGQIASLFVRVYLATEDEEFRRLALGAARPIARLEASELVTMTSDGPILEESPSTPPSHILNGWISGLWGLWDVQLALGDPGASAAFEAGLACLRSWLDAYDTGWWTRYSLYPHPLEDLAKPIYHAYHVDQVEVLHRLTGFDEFREAARRWRSYDTQVNRARAVAQKGAFALTRVARERRAEVRDAETPSD